MAAVTWSRLYGDTSSFAFQLQLETDPDAGVAATREEAESWGSFQIWVAGINLCAHSEQGEIVESVHWYMLPLLEWLVDNWDPLLHEERTPVPETASAVTAALRWRPDHDDGWYQWWKRHNLLSPRSGGLFPNLFIRRWRDRVEFSWNNESIPGAPDGFAFLASNGIRRVEVERVAVPLAEVIGAALSELSSRQENAARFREVTKRFKTLSSGTLAVQRARLGWLAGLGGPSRRFKDAWNKLHTELERRRPKIAAIVGGMPEHDPRFTGGTPHAAILFGSLSPTLRDQDIVGLSEVLIKSYSRSRRPIKNPLDAFAKSVQVDESLPPWEQGELLADDVLSRFNHHDKVPVDVGRMLRRLGIECNEIVLSDTHIRAISLLGPHHNPSIFTNDAYKDGTYPWILRFSMAHELAHLLVDRDRGQSVSVASGPWAPLGIEQRANAFAAALLIPESAVNTIVSTRLNPKTSWAAVQRVAEACEVSRLATIDRLYNLRYFERDERDRLRAFAIAEAEQAKLKPSAS